MGLIVSVADTAAAIPLCAVFSDRICGSDRISIDSCIIHLKDIGMLDKYVTNHNMSGAKVGFQYFKH